MTPILILKMDWEKHLMEALHRSGMGTKARIKAIHKLIATGEAVIEEIK